MNRATFDVFLGAVAFKSGCTFSIRSEKCGILDFRSNIGAKEMSKFIRRTYRNFRLITVFWRHNCIDLKTATTEFHIFLGISRDLLSNSKSVDGVKWTRNC